MKVIDLLNRIAKGKKIPKEVEITTGTLCDDYRRWYWKGCWYCYKVDDRDVWICTNELDLNDKVKVIRWK